MLLLLLDVNRCDGWLLTALYAAKDAVTDLDVMKGAVHKGIDCCTKECVKFSYMAATYEMDDACMCECITTRGEKVPGKPMKCKYEFQ